MRLIRAGVQGISEAGKFSGTFVFSDGLSVITGPNRYGKSLVFSAIVWCLGAEHIFGVLADDSSIFSDAAKNKFKYMDGDKEAEASVVDSWAFLEMNNAEGKKVTLIRSITRDKNHIHWIDEEKDVILATGLGSFQNETSGFQHYLFQFLGLEKRFLMSNRGSRTGIYFENLAPLFLIEQLGGWSDIQSEQTMRYGTRDINEGAFELLLGKPELLIQRLQAQNNDALQSGLKAEAKSIASDFTLLANSYGWDYALPYQGTVNGIREKLSSMDLSNEIKHRYSIDSKKQISELEARILFLRERLSSNTESNNPNKALTDSINRSIEMKTAKLEQEELISKLRRQLNEHERTLRSIAYQIESANDLIKFQRDGVGHLTSASCPTCHQMVEPSLVGSTDDFGTLVTLQKEQLERDQHIIGANIYRTENELRAAMARLNSVTEALDLARREISILQQLSSPEKEALLKISYDLIAAEKDLAKAIKLDHDIERIQALITDWLGRALVAGEAQRIEPLATAEVKDFLNHLRNYVVQTGCAGVGSGDGAHVTLDENYRPILRDRLLRSYGSASDRARLVIAYCLALLMSGKSHPGFLVFDEPLQQNPDPHHREKFLSFLKSFSKLKKQVLIFTNLKPDEIKALEEGECQVKQVSGRRFLNLVEKL